MLTANWGIANWADDPEMPPTRWDTLETIPPDERVPVEVVVYRIGLHAQAQNESLYRKSIARRWPRTHWGAAV